MIDGSFNIHHASPNQFASWRRRSAGFRCPELRFISRDRLALSVILPFHAGANLRISIQDFYRHDPAVAVLARDQALRDHIAEGFGEARSNRTWSSVSKSMLTKRSMVLTASTVLRLERTRWPLSAASSISSSIS